MVVALQATDLLVGVETRAYDAATRGELRVVTATADVRYVRVTVRVPGDRTELVSVLGHELQHALELSATPEVRDQASLRAFYQQIGWPAMNGGYVETDAALETGRRVTAEVAAARSARKQGS